MSGDGERKRKGRKRDKETVKTQDPEIGYEESESCVLVDER